MLLSRPTNATGFTLQSTLDLTPPVTWIDVTNSPAVIDRKFTLSNPVSGAAEGAFCVPTALESCVIA